MSVRKVTAQWEGTLKDGHGKMNITGYSGPFTFASRFENGEGTNPEELVGAAHAGCFSMFLAALISAEKLTPKSVSTTASVDLGKDDTGPCIQKITLDCEVSCDGLSEEKFNELSQTAKNNCPISRLYSGGTAEIVLNASLVS